MKLKYELYCLDNNLKVVLMPFKDVYSFSIGIVSNYGAALEPNKTRGITHFTEHIALSGSKSYYNKIAIAEAISQVGGTYNASTDMERVKFYSSLPYTSLKFGINFVYEIIFEPTFKIEAINKERTVIFDEIERVEDSLVKKLWNFENNNSYKFNTNYKYRVLGTKESIKDISRDDLINHHKAVTQPKNLYLYIKGNFDELEAKNLIEEYFAKKKNISEGDLIWPNEKLKTGLVLEQKDITTKLIHLTNRFPLNDLKLLQDEYEKLKLRLVFRMLAYTHVSRLYKKLRYEKGLLYDIENIISYYKPFGYSDNYFKISPEKFKECLKVYIEEIKQFIDKGVTQEELSLNKESLFNVTLMTRDTKLKEANILLDCLIDEKEYYSIGKLKRLLKNITLNEINNLIKSTIKLNESNFYIYGNIEDNISKFVKKQL